MTRRAPPQRGFSLLEAVVAMAIMAASLAVLYRAIGGSVRTAGEMAQQSRAVVVAESVLELRDAVPPGGWHDAGSTAGFRWRVSSAGVDAAREKIPLYRVQVEVAWNDGPRERTFSLVTIRPEEDRSGRQERR